MNCKLKQCGFSLAETLISLAVLTVGMLFIAGVFPVGIHFANLSTEQSIASVVADEAFAKVRLYAGRIPDVNENIPDLLFEHMRDFNDWFIDQTNDPGDEEYELTWDDFAYPSALSVDTDDKQYCWSALLRRASEYDSRVDKADPNREIQVTVFVCRRAGLTKKYYMPNLDEEDFDDSVVSYDDNYGIIEDWDDLSYWPRPVKVEVDDKGATRNRPENELEIKNSAEFQLINDGYRIVDDATGKMYRVLERYASPDDDTILLDKNQYGGIEYVWVVPPAKVGGKSPCIAVYQKILRF